MGIVGILASCQQHKMSSNVQETEYPLVPYSGDVYVVPINSNYVPTAKICTWKDNKRATYTIAFDDARSSHYQISGPELKKREIVGTFNLDTQEISNWYAWQKLFDEGNEIASHSWSHPRCTELSEEELRLELLLSKVDIIMNIKGISDVISFTYPFGAYNDLVRDIVLEYYLSARGVKKGINASTLTEEEFGMLKSIYVTPPYDINALNNLVQETIQDNGWSIFCFHSVSARDESDVNTIPLSLFRQHLDFVCSMKDSLWIATQSQVVEYMKIRENAHINCHLVNNETIAVTLSNILPFRAYEMKLSFILDMPPSWNNCYLIVKNLELNISDALLSTENTLLYNIRPGETLTIRGIK